MKLLTSWVTSKYGFHQNRSDSYERPNPKACSDLGSSRDKTLYLYLRALFLTVFVLWVVAIYIPTAFAQSGRVLLSVGTPTVDANGVKYYPVTSVYQGSQQQIIRVLEPTNPAPGKPPRQLYVLPVDAGVDTLSSTYSDGLEELRLLNVPNRFNMTLIAPSFNYEPWYGDNIIAPTNRMESFLIDDLVPFGDTFAHGASIPQRYLIGFSKSGNGVLCLILRHPGVFNGAADWDSPAQVSDLSSFSDLPMNFGTQANFNLYNIPALVSRSAGPFQQQNRLWISGDQAVFTTDMTTLHSQLTAASIPHTWVQGGSRAHSWNSGWLDGAVIDLDANATLTPPAAGTLPPVRSGGQPTGVLAPGTSQTTLSLMTDGNATCRYVLSCRARQRGMTNNIGDFEPNFLGAGLGQILGNDAHRCLHAVGQQTAEFAQRPGWYNEHQPVVILGKTRVIERICHCGGKFVLLEFVVIVAWLDGMTQTAPRGGETAAGTVARRITRMPIELGGRQTRKIRVQQMGHIFVGNEKLGAAAIGNNDPGAYVLGHGLSP